MPDDKPEKGNGKVEIDIVQLYGAIGNIVKSVDDLKGDVRPLHDFMIGQKSFNDRVQAELFDQNNCSKITAARHDAQSAKTWVQWSLAIFAILVSIMAFVGHKGG